MVLAKLIEARRELRKRKLVRTGYNEEGDYHDFELSDIQKDALECLEDVGLAEMFSTHNDYAEMLICDVETGLFEAWNLHIEHANVAFQKTTGMKGVGAVSTYARRYLLMSVMAIDEDDAVEKQRKKEKKEKEKEEYEAKKKELIEKSINWFLRLQDKLYELGLSEEKYCNKFSLTKNSEPEKVKGHVERLKNITDEQLKKARKEVGK
jgi:hypothetical protein